MYYELPQTMSNSDLVIIYTVPFLNTLQIIKIYTITKKPINFPVYISQSYKKELQYNSSVMYNLFSIRINISMEAYRFIEPHKCVKELKLRARICLWHPDRCVCWTHGLKRLLHDYQSINWKSSFRYTQLGRRTTFCYFLCMYLRTTCVLGVIQKREKLLRLLRANHCFHSLRNTQLTC